MNSKYFSTIANWSSLVFLVSLLEASTVKTEPNGGSEQFKQNGIFDISKIFPTVQNQPKRYALSTTYLSYLCLKEPKIYNLLKSFDIKVDDELRRIINNYIEDYEETAITNHLGYSEYEQSKLLGPPLLHSTFSSYFMIRRFAVEFRTLRLRLRGPLQQQIQNILEEGLELPNEQDHHEAMEGLLRLQYFYNISSEILANERLPLKPKHAMELANYALDQRYYTLSFDWIRATESLSSFNQDQPDILKKLIQLHDNDWGYNEPTYMFAQKLGDTNIQNITIPRLRDINLRKFVGILEDRKLNNHYNLIALCNGQNLQTEKLKAQLLCKYDQSSNTYWRISPLKTEFLSIEPLVVQFYDVVTNSDIKSLVQLAIPTLEKAPPSRATPRTATYAWLSDKEIENSTKLISKIESISGLNVFGEGASEYLQIAAYAFGGHVSIHVDSLPENNFNPVILEKGNRVSTFLIYLNDMVHGGGRTAFPLLGTFVNPVKGSGVLWYTSKKNGSIDRRLLHAACPTFGQKWIATKWTHLHKNFLTRKCSTNPLE